MLQTAGQDASKACPWNPRFLLRVPHYEDSMHIHDLYRLQTWAHDRREHSLPRYRPHMYIVHTGYRIKRMLLNADSLLRRLHMMCVVYTRSDYEDYTHTYIFQTESDVRT